VKWLRTIWYVLTLRCEEADRLRAVARHGELSRSERVAERLHRSLCSSCRHAAAQIERIDRGLDRLADGVADHAVPGWSEERRARLEAALREADQKN